MIHSSKPGEENKSDEKGPGPQTIKPQPERMQQVEPKPKEKSAEEPPSATARATPKSSSGAEPRRFHFSRPIIVPSPLLNAGLSATGKRSRHNTPTTTVFVERGHKRTRTEDVHMKDADAKDSGELHEPPRKLKLPGSDRKSSATGKPAVPVKKEIPASMNKHWTTEMDEITRNMNDFALQLIGENLAKIEERDKKEAAAAAKKEALSAAASPQASRFKPKVPAKRYAERHPEVAAVRQQETESTTEQDEYETGSEDEYVVETYVRVPASSLGKDINPGKVGLLVFDNEPDVDFFYAEEGDSDDEWAEDEEDENGESPFAYLDTNMAHELTCPQRRIITLRTTQTKKSIQMMSLTEPHITTARATLLTWRSLTNETKMTML